MRTCIRCGVPIAAHNASNDDPEMCAPCNASTEPARLAAHNALLAAVDDALATLTAAQPSNSPQAVRAAMRRLLDAVGHDEIVWHHIRHSIVEN